jgi:glycosyltransferase involved in cell wall biosynthesis
MKILFQTIGVLVQYNWALPYYLTVLEKQNSEVYVKLDTNLFSYLMGGFYYHLKQPKKLIPFFSGSGIFSRLDKILGKTKVSYKLAHFDIIHLNEHHDELTNIALKTRIPKVFTFHGSLDPDHIKNVDNACKTLKEIADKATFVAVSQHSSNTLARYCGIRAHVIHNGVDTEIFNPSLPKIESRKRLHLPLDKKIILWSGRVEPDKGLHKLLVAIPKIIKERKDIMFIVKGRSINKNYLTPLKNFIKRKKLEQFIKFDLSWTPNIFMLLLYYRASDLYVHTSISEGFSLTLLEAMSSGIPVIGRNASSIPEAIGDKTLLFNDEDELAEKILELLSDKDVSEKIGIKLFRRVIERGFTSIEQAKKYLNLYREIMG